MSKMKVSVGLVSSGYSAEESVPCLSPSSQGFLASPDVPHLVDTSLQSLPPSLVCSPRVSVSLFPLTRRTPAIGLGSTLIQFDLILTNRICKDPISKQGHIRSFCVDTNLEETLFSPV